MKLKLVRDILTSEVTFGRLYVDDKFFCYTLEDTYRDLKDLNNDKDFDDVGEGKIYGQTCIPFGDYSVEMRHSPKFNKDMPYILNIRGFAGVMFHIGNFAKDTNGCILVGIERVVKENRISGSTATFANLYKLFLIRSDEKHILEIVKKEEPRTIGNLAPSKLPLSMS